MIKVTPTKLEEVLVLEYDVNQDSRGDSYRTFSKQDLDDIGIATEFIEETIYCPTKKGTLYGIHFQNHPMAHTKLLYCIKGSGLDFAVDLRHNSKTYKQWICVNLTSKNRLQLYIPSGFGHAFLSLEDDTNVVMRIDTCFHSDYARAVAYNDSDLNVDFPINNPILSDMDIHAPFLRDSDCNL